MVLGYFFYNRMSLNILNYNKKLYPLNITRKFLYILNNFLNKISISLLEDKIITKRLIRNIMELHLKLKNIDNEKINQVIFEDNLLLALKLKDLVFKKRRKFSHSLKKIKNLYVEKNKKLAFVEAKKEYFEEFFKANDFYKESVLNANKDCLNVALKVANEILQKEVTDDCNILINKIKNELKKLCKNSSMKIMCNNEVSQAIKSEITNIETIVDDALSNKIAYILSSSGSIQIDIDNEFNFLRNKLLENLEKIC
ncbi:MAG: hypothetical protein SPJ04_05620 [Bdellovibrionota bacterium]|nr:hypothetical protein [Bdellovibrionota bacterium]